MIERSATDPAVANRSGRLLAIAAPIADVVLVVAFLFLAVQLGFAFLLDRSAVFKGFYAVGIACAAAARGLGSPSLRVNASLMLAPFVGGLLAYELYSTWRRPGDGTAAWLAGRSFDSRGFWEALDEEREKDPALVPYVIPRAMLTHRLIVEHWEPEEVARTVRPDWGIVVDGVQTLPLSGMSNRRTLFGNESGTWIIYGSDERGFNNPPGIWSSGPVQLGIIGDSFSQGAGVARQAMAASHIRKRYPGTLTLGMAANGPLMEYASLKEHLIDVKPPIVLWVYYLNDLSDMEVEKASPLLWRYLEEDGFRQGLAAKQSQVDAALEAYLDRTGRSAPRRWPTSLKAAGLTRQTTPLWLQDLVTSEHHSSLASFLRLDGLSWFVTKRFLETNHFEQPPDYALFERILAKARDVVASWGGRLYFVYLPAVHHLARNRYIASREPVLALVQRLGIPLIDVHRVFLDHPDPESLRFHYESHANEAGYELHAQTILEALDAASRASGTVAAPGAPP